VAKQLLVFSPYSGIWPHGISESQLISQLDAANFEPTFVVCNGVLKKHCTVMESQGVEADSSPSERQKVCRSCKASTRLLAKSFEHKTIELDSFLESGDIDWASDLVEKAQPESYLNLLADSFEIGRLCAYETLIKFKKTTTNLNSLEFSHFKDRLLNGALSLRACQRIFGRETYDAVLIYSPQYSANTMCAEVALSRNIPVYFTEGSSNISERYRAIRIWSWKRHKLVNPALNYWNSSTPSPSSEERRRIEQHFLEIKRGRSFGVYSRTSRKKLDIRKKFKIEDSTKVLLATVSSYDEAFSAMILGAFPEQKFKSDVFESQFDWIENLIDWVKNRIEVHLIIRLHPRDLPNRRESVTSEQIHSWETTLRNLPSNVSIDHPLDGIPIASYIGTVSALTTGWSSTAVEALMENVPVVTYDANLPSYPKEIHLSGRSPEEYWMNLDHSLTAELRIDTRSELINWLNLNFNLGTVRVNGRLLDEPAVQKHIGLYLLVGGITKLFPAISRRLDLILAKFFPKGADSSKLNTVLNEKLDSLYDVQTSSTMRVQGSPLKL